MRKRKWKAIVFIFVVIVIIIFSYRQKEENNFINDQSSSSLTTNSIEENEYHDFYEAEIRKQSVRIRFLREKCPNNVTQTKDVGQSFIVEPKTKTIYCYLPKGNQHHFKYQ